MSHIVAVTPLAEYVFVYGPDECLSQLSRIEGNVWDCVQHVGRNGRSPV